MPVTQRIAALAIALTAAGFPPLAAQIDYRNLDDHRPVRTEDAYPIERYAFELLIPALDNFGTEGRALPGLGLRGDVAWVGLAAMGGPVVGLLVPVTPAKPAAPASADDHRHH
jgi:hypothetical protein